MYFKSQSSPYDFKEKSFQSTGFHKNTDNIQSKEEVSELSHFELWEN